MTRLLLALCALGCAEATAPRHLVVTCSERVIQTPQGPWHTGEQTCEWLDPVTGQGGPGRHP